MSLLTNFHNCCEGTCETTPLISPAQEEHELASAFHKVSLLRIGADPLDIRLIATVAFVHEELKSMERVKLSMSPYDD